VRTLDDKMQEKADKTIVKQIDERIQKMSHEKKCCNDTHNSVSDTEVGLAHADKLNHIVDKNIDEQKSRDRRKENVIVFNIGESTSEVSR